MDIRRKNRKLVRGIVSLFALAVLITAGTLGFFWYKKTHGADSTNQSSPGGTISLSDNTSKKLETETIQTTIFLPAPNSKVGDSVRLSVLGITVPKAWRTVNAKNLLNTQPENVYATTSNDILAQFVMVPESNPNDPSMAANSFGLYNIAAWMSKPTQTSNGTVTPAAKAAYIQNIADLGDGKAPNKAVCAKGYGLFSTLLCGPMVGAQPVSSNDGLLKGIAFIGTTSQTATYDPEALVFMTGKVKEQQLFAYGVFHLLDNNSHTLSATDTAALKTAWDSVQAGTVPTDTQQLFQHVVDAVKSITLQVN